MSNKKITAPKGTHDILPESMHIWDYIETTMKDACKNYNYHEIRFPVFENTELFFNISHTEGAVFVGLSRRELGVDLEKERKAPIHLRKMLQPEDDFFSAWVRWEACAKCLGVSVLSLLRNGVLPEGVAYQEVETFTGYRAGAAEVGGEIDPKVEFVDSQSVLAWCKGSS